MQWVYQEKFDHVHSEGFDRHESIYEILKCDFEYYTLPQLWVLADKFLILRLQNYTMNIMCRKQTVCKTDMSIMNYSYVYNNTAEDSALRRFVVAQSCWGEDKFHWTRDALDLEKKRYQKRYPKEMLMDMVTVFKASIPVYIREQKQSMEGVSLEDFLVPENPSTAS
ncbi:8918fa6f-a8a0-4f37-a1ee-78242bb6795c [Sclerotinia trifoliorum]|uniref:8918fa6f-a8a0-4f37-a1ee-78242bb6795c n=1 Tax=Sclerotinia trifoliorum TaxID=28548 RepID=A0A8H2VMI9_9HELO|nr:8918fa6f-a8a0-4f37-a1ee-78242bb6795c [Sclerotinia trifoliorum]